MRDITYGPTWTWSKWSQVMGIFVSVRSRYQLDACVHMCHIRRVLNTKRAGCPASHRDPFAILHKMLHRVGSKYGWFCCFFLRVFRHARLSKTSSRETRNCLYNSANMLWLELKSGDTFMSIEHEWQIAIRAHVIRRNSDLYTTWRFGYSLMLLCSQAHIFLWWCAAWIRLVIECLLSRMQHILFHVTMLIVHIHSNFKA